MLARPDQLEEFPPPPRRFLVFPCFCHFCQRVKINSCPWELGDCSNWEVVGTLGNSITAEPWSAVEQIRREPPHVIMARLPMV